MPIGEARSRAEQAHFRYERIDPLKAFSRSPALGRRTLAKMGITAHVSRKEIAISQWDYRPGMKRLDMRP
jgi:hypothetical protein